MTRAPFAVPDAARLPPAGAVRNTTCLLLGAAAGAAAGVAPTVAGWLTALGRETVEGWLTRDVGTADIDDTRAPPCDTTLQTAPETRLLV